MAGSVWRVPGMPWLLGWLGWRWTLALGSGLLGLPAAGHLATDRVAVVIAGLAARAYRARLMRYRALTPPGCGRSMIFGTRPAVLRPRAKEDDV